MSEGNHRAEQGEVDGTVYTPYRVDVPPSDDPVIEMKRAVIALAWELPDEVWRDVRDRWNAVAAHVRELRDFKASFSEPDLSGQPRRPSYGPIGPN